MGSILVTDDDKECRDAITRVLEREGHNVRGVGDVDSAMDALRRQPFDLLICDYRMPGKTGIDLLHELADAGRTIPVLLLSAFTDSETVRLARKAGAFDVLKKPVRRRELAGLALAAILTHPASIAAQSTCETGDEHECVVVGARIAVEQMLGEHHRALP